MIVKAIGAKWCNKCKEAKAFLTKYDVIEWIDLDINMEGTEMLDYFEEEHIPFFIAFNDVNHNLEVIRTFKSYRELAKWLEKISSE